MHRVTHTKQQSGFTLVELLIVAIILAILAAIIIPQFASTTVDAQESALKANLSGLRSAANLYRQQHGEYPGVATAIPAGGLTCGGTAGAGAGGDQATLQSQLTLYSNRNGMSCSAAGADFPLGPYVQDAVLPTNPITDNGTVVIVTAGDLNMTAGTGLGWQYDSVTGKIIANDDGLDSAGVAYSTY